MLELSEIQKGGRGCGKTLKLVEELSLKLGRYEALGTVFELADMVKAKQDRRFVEIKTRCKGCKYYENFDNAVPDVYFCTIFGGVATGDDGFCCMGERREKE
jgi:hypothetical protein